MQGGGGNGAGGSLDEVPLADRKRSFQLLHRLFGQDAEVASSADLIASIWPTSHFFRGLAVRPCPPLPLLRLPCSRLRTAEPSTPAHC